MIGRQLLAEFPRELVPVLLPGSVLVYCVLLVNLKASIISGTSFPLESFPVIRKMRLHLHLRSVVSEA